MTSAASNSPLKHGKEDALAIAREPLRLDDRPRVRRRRYIDVGDVLVAQCLRHQHRRIRAKARFDIPTRKIATGRDSAVRRQCRTNKQDRAHNDAIALQHIPVFRKTRRRLVLCQPREGVQPEPAIMRREPVRQERRCGFDIGFIDLTAAQSLCSAACFD